jgi:hypothetical protein
MESNMRKHSWQACFENFSCNILQRVILPCAMYFLGYPTRLPSRLLSSWDPYGPLGQIMAHVSIVEPVGIQHIQPVGWTPDLLLKSGRCCDRNSGKGSRFPRRLVCLVILGHAPVVMSQRLFWWQEWSTVYPSGDLQLSWVFFIYFSMFFHIFLMALALFFWWWSSRRIVPGRGQRLASSGAELRKEGQDLGRCTGHRWSVICLGLYEGYMMVCKWYATMQTIRVITNIYI